MLQDCIETDEQQQHFPNLFNVAIEFNRRFFRVKATNHPRSSMKGRKQKKTHDGGESILRN